MKKPAMSRAERLYCVSHERQQEEERVNEDRKSSDSRYCGSEPFSGMSQSRTVAVHETLVLQLRADSDSCVFICSPESFRLLPKSSAHAMRKENPSRV